MIALAGTGTTKLVTRAEWAAASPRYVTRFTPSFGTTAHWEGPKMPAFPHAACASYVRGIQSFHMRSVASGGRGWSDIAYTVVVCPHGYVYEGRWIGHRTGANGTNVGNGSAYAICYLGGEGNPFTSEADRAFHDTTTHLRLHGRAGPGVNCHRDWKSTACPGNRICGRVKAGAWNSNAGTVTPSVEEITEELKDMDTRKLHICQPKGSPHWYVSDGIFYKHLKNREHAAVLVGNFGASVVKGTGSMDKANLDAMEPHVWPKAVFESLELIGTKPQ